MFSNSKVTFSHQPSATPLLCISLPPFTPTLLSFLHIYPFTLILVSALILFTLICFDFSPFPLLYVNLKLQVLWSACMMWASAKWWIFFPFIPHLFLPVVFLIFCWLVWLRVWTCLFIQVSANKHDIFFLLCVAKSLDLEALVLIMSGRGTEHQNAQTRKIFSCLLWCRDFFGTVNKLE